MSNKMSSFKIALSKDKIGEEIQDKLINSSYKEYESGNLTDTTRGISLVSNRIDDNLDFHYGNSFYFAVRNREQSIDSKMVKEHFMYLMDKESKENGDVISRKRKKEIKETAIQLVEDKKVLKTTGTRVTIPANAKTIIVETPSEKKAEEVLLFLTEDVLKDKEVNFLTPEMLYSVIKKSKSVEYNSLSINGQLLSSGIGVDFLTWLWAISETEKCLKDKGIQVIIFGDIEFRNDAGSSKGPVKTKMSKGIPWEGDSVKGALLDGKKVSSVGFRFQKNDSTVYSVVINEGFTFKKFDFDSIDTEESLSKEDLFADVITNIQEFLSLFVDLFKIFIEMEDENQEIIDNWCREKFNR